MIIDPARELLSKGHARDHASGSSRAMLALLDESSELTRMIAEPRIRGQHRHQNEDGGHLPI